MRKNTLAWLAVAIVFIAHSSFAEEPNREKLITELVTLGETASAKDKQSAQWAYSFAVLYAPNDPEIKKKKEAIGGWSFNASKDEKGQMSSAMSHLNADNFKPWPDPTAEMEPIELQMLLDKQLVGDLHYADFRVAGVWGFVFTAKPSLTVAKVKLKYGKPSAEKKGKDGSVLLTYGRFRLAADKSGNVAGVFFQKSGQ